MCMDVLVLDGDKDLPADPQGTMELSCKFAGVDFDRSTMGWEAKELEARRKFEGWHDEAASTTGIREVDAQRVEQTAEQDASVPVPLECTTTFDATVLSAYGEFVAQVAPSVASDLVQQAVQFCAEGLGVRQALIDAAWYVAADPSCSDRDALRAIDFAELMGMSSE